MSPFLPVFPSRAWYVCCVLFLISAGQSFGQVRVRVRFVEYHTPTQDPVFNFRIDNTNYWWGGSAQGFGMNITEHCFSPGASMGTYLTNPNDPNFLLCDGVSVSPLFKLTMRSFKHIGGDVCKVDKQEEQCTESIKELSDIDLYNQPPGVESEPIQIEGTTMQCADGGAIWAKVRVMHYTPPPPAISFLPNTDTRYCLADNITLKASLPSATINQAMYDGLAYRWEYLMDTTYSANPLLPPCITSCDCVNISGGTAINCVSKWPDGVIPTADDIAACKVKCAEDNPPIPTYHWKTLPFNTAEVTFVPKNVIETTKQFDQNRAIIFRCTVYHPTDTRIYSEPSAFLLGDLLAASPKFSASASDIVVTTSCHNMGTGSLTVKNITKQAEGDYKYSLFVGNGISGVPIEANTHSTGSNLVITNLAGGDYTLQIANNGGTQGACYSTKSITIPSYPLLTLPDITPTHVSCYNGVDGKIVVTPAGGHPNDFTIELSKGGSLLSTATGRTAQFAGLAVGEYMVTVKDACSAVLMQTVVVKQPPQTAALWVSTDSPTCDVPANGRVTLKDNTQEATVANYLLARADNVSYQLYKAGDLTTPIQIGEGVVIDATAREFVLVGLGAGAYVVRIQNGATPLACPNNVAQVSFTVQGAPVIPSISATLSHVLCAGGNTGAVTLLNPAFDTYQYSLKNTISGEVTMPSQNPIEGLMAGTYELKRMRWVSGCQDAKVLVFEITQPAPLAAQSQLTMPDCFGGNGQLAYTLTGGTPPYQLQLMVEGAVIESVNLTGATHNFAVPQGTYTLKTTDAHGCALNSPALVMSEPAQLVVGTPVLSPIQCWGEQARISLAPSGGTGAIAWEYTAGDWANALTFTSQTPFNAGTYKIRARDSKGCVSVYANDIIIDAPTAPLAWAYTLGNFNGYHVACYGDMAQVAVQITGGGSNYQYRVDGGAWQPASPTIEAPAGTHLVEIRDDRGCMVGETFTILQPAASLVASISEVQHLACPSLPTGSFKVNVSGGSGSPQYSLDNGITFQTSPIFTSLGLGTYTVLARDNNGCSAQASVTLQSLFPPIEIHHTQQNVRCFGGNDGEILLQPTGGKGGYTYLWEGRSETTARFQQLRAGTYTVKVTDESGCSETKIITLLQPEKALKLVEKTLPVCAEQTNGSISFSCEGGTAPYTHRVVGAGLDVTRVGNSAVFDLPAGSYRLFVTDAHGCPAEGQTVIETRNVKPVPKFLVSTRTNALDTLLLKEISTPKPDKITWTFPQEALVIDADAWSPQIRFPQAGTYPITMIGEFAGCVYSVTKQLQIAPFDPNATNVLPTGATRMLKSLTVSPVPNDGHFRYTIEVAKKRRVQVSLLNMMGVVVYRKEWNGEMLLTEEVSLPDLPNGLYVLRVLTDIDARQQNVSISK